MGRRQNGIYVVIWELQDRRCIHCNEWLAGHPRTNNQEDGWTREHVVPRSKGGGEIKRNIVLACRDCNSRRGNTDPDEALIERAALIYRRALEIYAEYQSHIHCAKNKGATRMSLQKFLKVNKPQLTQESAA